MSFDSHKQLLEQALSAIFAPNGLPQQTVLESSRYSLLAGGKRLRGVFLMEFCRLCGGTVEEALPFACAIEMIHAYSLVHDDLPCMDNDDLRRGKPTNHKVYGEAMALLAGDALLNGAYEILLEQATKGEKQAKAGYEIAKAAGVWGMIGGQVLDIAEGIKSLEQLQHMVSLKTGRLFLAACLSGAILGGGSEKQLAAAVEYADKLGLAFQIQDDILDVVGNTEKLGKKIKSDETINKYTFVSALGVEECRRYADNLTDEAIAAASVFSDNGLLVETCNNLREREN